MNSIQSAQFDEFKIARKKFKNLPKTGKIAEVFFLPMRFHLMRQSELKVRANKQFLLVDNDAQRIGDDFLITVLYIQLYRHLGFKSWFQPYMHVYTCRDIRRAIRSTCSIAQPFNPSHLGIFIFFTIISQNAFGISLRKLVLLYSDAVCEKQDVNV